METLLEYKGDTMIVRLMGELDQHYASQLRRAIDTQVTHRGIHKIVFDFSNVGFMDSSGIGMMIGRYKTMAKRGGSVAVRPGGRQVDRLMELSGLYQIIEKLA